MSTKDLELAILELIKRIYCVEYCGYIEVKEVKDCTFCYGCCDSVVPQQTVAYELVLGLQSKDKPLRLAFSGTPEAFLRFIAKELKDRNLNKTQYFNGYKFDPNDTN